MNIAVTGANGHIGAALCRRLIDDGHHVRVLIFRDDRALAGLPVEKITGSVTDGASLDRLCRDVEIVYHLAAVISIQGDQDGSVAQTNLEGTRQVVEACLRAGVRRLVHFSSIHAYRMPPFDQILDETTPLIESGYAYEQSKSAAQRLVMQAVEQRGLNAVSLNPTSVLGPWDVKPSLQGKMLIDLCHGRIPVLPPGGYDWVDNRDIAEAAVAAMDCGEKGNSYLLPGQFATVKQLVEFVGKITGKPMPKHTLPFWLMDGMAPLAEAWGRLTRRPPVLTKEAIDHLRLGHPKVSGQKAMRELGYHPRSLEETLRDTLNSLDVGRLTSDV
jgi:dihydroflavonol-4-reductase